jgi:putative ABC transport system permease protein
MTFVIRMAWREVRNSWIRLVFFFLCVGIGVAAIVALRSVIQTVRITLTGEARSLVGADLVVQTPRAPSAELRARLDGAFRDGGVVATSNLVDTQTMVAPAARGGTGGVKLVELRGVEPAYPFYGRIELEGGQPYSHALLEQHGAIVQPELLVALDLAVGDRVTIGGQVFTIRAAIARDRVSRGGIAFGPRVYVDLADLRTTSLIGFGSRSSHQVLVEVADPGRLGTLTSSLKALLSREIATVRSWQTLEDRIGRNLTTAENYLSLVGLAIVVLGGIGVWSVTRVIVQQKIRSVAILKCLGASGRQVLSTYVLHVLVLAAAGCLLGLGIGAVAVRALPPSLLEPMGVASVRVTWSAAAQGVAVGLLVSLLFALVPLLEIRRVKPLLLLRATGGRGRRDWQTVLAGGAVAVALAAVAVWQADSMRAGVYVTTGLIVVAGVLYAASRALVGATRGLTRSGAFVIRHAVIGLGRPGNQTRVIVMSVGLGCFFVLGVRAVQTNLLADLAQSVGQNAPDLIVVDIQPDQVAQLPPVLSPYLRDAARVVPLMRGRVAAVSGRRITLATPEAVREDGHLTREFGITFRTTVEPNERLVAGRFWTAAMTPGETFDGADTEVSIERDMHEESHVDVGDLIRFDIGGQPLRARVTSIRSVEWGDAQNGAFVFVLRPGPAVDRLAHTFVGFLQVRDDPAARGALQRDVVKALPNVSVIDVRDVLATIREVVENVSLGITAVGIVTLLSGALILVGAVAMTRFQRTYEAAIYRTLGASARLVGLVAAVEYGLLGALAGVLGASGALALSWLLARYLFDMRWRPAPLLLATGCIVTAVAVAVVGLAASADVLVRKPLSALRGE